jgi:hypothetical protein
VNVIGDHLFDFPTGEALFEPGSEAIKSICVHGVKAPFSIERKGSPDTLSPGDSNSRDARAKGG